MGLTHRQRNVKDKRINEAVVTPEGKMMTDKIDHTRALIYNDIFNSWPDNDRVEFERLLKNFVHDFNALESIKSV